MALSRLLQPNSTLRFCRLGYSAARARLCSSECSNGDSDSPPQLKEAAAATAEDIKAVPKESDLLTSTSLTAEDGRGREPKTLSGLFMVRERDDDTAEKNEKREQKGHILNDLMMHEKYGRSSQFSNCPNGLDLKHLALQSANGRTTQETDGPKNLESVPESPKHSHQLCEEDSEKEHYKGLIESLSIRVKKSPSQRTYLSTSKGFVKEDSSNANVQRSNKHDRLNSQTFPAGTSFIDDREMSKSGSDSKEQKKHLKVPLPVSNKDKRQKQRQNSAGTESGGNRVLVRFLPNAVSMNQIFRHFKDCGEILKIECPYAQGPLLKTACVDFKTRDGLQKAIGKSGTHIVGQIIVESATSENRTKTIPVPSLLEDPDIPAALVKNPTRTIRIEPLTQEMSLRHIVEALAFCKSEVSGYFLGSSDSVAYVELETEIGKERVLAKQSINVLGRNLVMLRIDCPRTTVARITSRHPLELNQIITVCKALGDICSCKTRNANMIDVHYKVAEWPNMLKILNRLNGCEVNGRLLQAEPAPIFPPEVLLALWHHPEGQKHLEATAQALLLKLDTKLDTSELAFLENDIFST